MEEQDKRINSSIIEEALLREILMELRTIREKIESMEKHMTKNTAYI